MPRDDLHALHASMIGAAPAFSAALALLSRFAMCSAPVLILGETGTGKELAARAVHYCSPRRDEAFVPVNCGALPDTLIESELFGHARGAFTDARSSRRGLVAQAQRGTLFLDEVEALSARAQVALLRFVQDASFRAVGADDVQHADVRIVGASNVDLAQLVAAGNFRADLLFRLQALAVVMPPLRERPGDVALLVPQLLIKAARGSGCEPKRLTADALALLESHAWPGNVRELENTLLRAQLLSSGPIIDSAELRAAVPALSAAAVSDLVATAPRGSLRKEKQIAADEAERRYVAAVLAQTSGNISAAARLCHMQRATLSKLVKKHALATRPAVPAL